MPTTRRGPIPSTSERRCKFRLALSLAILLTLTVSGLASKAAHRHDHASTAPDRPSKRRRTGPSSQKASNVESFVGELPPSVPHQDRETLSPNHALNDGPYGLHAQSSTQPDHHGGPLTSTVHADTFGQLDPEMTKAISDIIDHSERFEQYCASHDGEDAALSGPKAILFAKTGSRMKVESLPILDNLSSQILFTFAKSSYPDIVALMKQSDTEAGQEYATVRSLFDHTKRVYSSKSPFLSPSELDLLEPAQVEILRKANLATFVSSVFGSQEIGFAELDDHFLHVFVPENARLLKAQGSLFLDLKTQAFISSMFTRERSRTELLYTLFPDDIEARVLARRPGARSLAPSEQDFVKRVLSRREILLADVNNTAALEALSDRYQWDDFLRDISSYISKNFESLSPQPKLKPATTKPNSETKEFTQEQLQSNFSIRQVPPVEHVTALPKQEDFVAKAARAAQIALQSHNISIPAPGPPQMQPYPPGNLSSELQIELHTSFQEYTPPNQSVHTMPSRSSLPPSYGPLPNLPHVSQTAPTQVLYERARQAATTKSTPATRRVGLPSQRRPWTTDEENSLMAGLDRVRGPHWSQILAMFGPGGTVNESLKDRNQVQLKDKARNLKLFFLKSGIEVPYYLKYVTGDLKTRAPGQASKHEARGWSRQQGEEDKAHFNGVQGIMALAGVDQQKESHRQDQQNRPRQDQVDHPIMQADSGGLSELQRFGSEDAHAHDELRGLQTCADANVDPNLSGLSDLSAMPTT